MPAVDDDTNQRLVDGQRSRVLIIFLFFFISILVVFFSGRVLFLSFSFVFCCFVIPLAILLLPRAAACLTGCQEKRARSVPFPLPKFSFHRSRLGVVVMLWETGGDSQQ